MHTLAAILLISYLSYVVSDNIPQGSPVAKASEARPIYQPQESADYVPHATYPYADSYGPHTPYQGYETPSAIAPLYSPYSYITTIVPKSIGFLRTALNVAAKVGLFLLGGVALLLVGGVFTTAVCSLTPLCTISFAGIGGLNKDTMRSFVTAEGVASAVAAVERAVNKYQNLQETKN